MGKTYIHYDGQSFNKDKFTPIRNSPWKTKPHGGLWASDINSEYGWKDWCKENDFRECNDDDSFTFTLSDDAKVLVIDSMDCIDNLPIISTWTVFNNNDTTYYLDFEELKKEYDAIELVLSNDYKLYWALYGWDCDSILVMNPNILVMEGK